MQLILSRSKIEVDPNSIWNSFVNLLATSDPISLEPRQRDAHLAFQYNSEVNNGGHFQYFINCGNSVVLETIQSLRSLGAERQAEVLSDARTAFGHIVLPPICDSSSYLKAEAVASLDAFDEQLANCEPGITTILAAHLREHFDWYIKITED